MRSDRLRVILADADPLACRAIRQGFDHACEFLVVAETADGVEACELAVHYRPEMVLMSGNLLGLDGVAACGRILAKAPDVRVLLLASESDPARELVGLRAGAWGMVAKEVGVDALVDAARGVCAGRMAVSPEATRRLVERLRLEPEGGVGMRPVRSRLTPREWEVLDFLAQGLSTRDISEQLFLTQDTVQSHIKNILRKLGVHSRAEAIARIPELRSPLTLVA